MNNKIKKINSGIALMEVIIYMGLFSILIGGLVLIAYELMISSDKISSKYQSQEEINFVLKKIDWALSDASDINISGGILDITKQSDHIYFKQEDEKIKYCENICSPSDYLPLTTSNVKVNKFDFTPIGTSPIGISINLGIDGIIINHMKYLKI